MLLQNPTPASQIVPLIVAAMIFAVIIGAIIAWNSKTRAEQVRRLDNMLEYQPSISLLKLSTNLDNRGLDRSTMISLVNRSSNGILSFVGSNVISRPIFSQKLREHLMDSRFVDVPRVAIDWGLTEDVVEKTLREIAARESLDIVFTTEGCCIHLPEFKANLRDTLRLHGRLDISSEASRMGVDLEELLNLIRGWGWDLMETTTGLVISIEWLRSQLEQSLAHNHSFDINEEAVRLDIRPEDIQCAIRLFDWKILETNEGRLMTEAHLRDLLEERLEQAGELDLQEEASQLGIDTGRVRNALLQHGSIVETDDGNLTNFNQIRRRVQDDLELMGQLQAETEAKSLGVDAKLVEQVLKQIPDARQVKDGRFISIVSFKRWAHEQAKQKCLLSTDNMRDEWGVSTVDIHALLKRVGISTVTTKDGDFCSIASCEREIRKQIAEGNEVDVSWLEVRFRLGKGYAQAILAGTEADAILSSDGQLIPRATLEAQIKQRLESEGHIEPGQFCNESGIPRADFDWMIRHLTSPLLEARDDRILDAQRIVSKVRNALARRGVLDIRLLSDSLRVEYMDLFILLDSHLEDGEVLSDSLGIILREELVAELQELRGAFRVSGLARKYELSRSLMLKLLRRFTKGRYLPDRDLFEI
ncbi:hypothetical protein EU538_04610 [Candidatus Thorarchaeota archaeon]|nr:MAG: hypothetical protein EU538_04610 [Candidatus Thorarchaeota archaeon]